MHQWCTSFQRTWNTCEHSDFAAVSSESTQPWRLDKRTDCSGGKERRAEIEMVIVTSSSTAVELFYQLNC